MNKKGLGAVVATSLLLIVGVVAVVSFQSWYSTFQSSKLVDVSQQSHDGLSSSIESLVGTNLYLKSNSNLTVNSVIINGINCKVSDTLSLGVDNLDISSCLSNLSEGKSDILILTNKGTLQKVINLKFNNCLGGVSHGNSGLYYNISSVYVGETCYNQTRTCNNGALSGDNSYSYSSCTIITGPPILTFNSNDTDVAFGENINLTWSNVGGATTCVASDGWSGSKSVVGSEEIGPIFSAFNYTLNCSNAYGSDEVSIFVNVHDPYWSDVVLSVPFDGTPGSTAYVDLSSLSHSFTTGGTAAISSTQSRFGGTSLYSPGGLNANWVDVIEQGSEFHQFGENFTMEGWYYSPSGGINQGLFTSTQGYSSWYPSFQLYLSNTGSLSSTINNAAPILVQNSPSTATWVHFAVVQDQLNTQIRYYINGVLLQTYSGVQQDTSNLNLELATGRGNGGGANRYGFTGYLDSIRYTRGVARYSGSSFPVPTAAYPQR